MKATLDFTLPDEQHEFSLAVNGYRFAEVIKNMDESLRRVTKYGTLPGGGEASDLQVQEANRWREELAALCEAAGVAVHE